MGLCDNLRSTLDSLVKTAKSIADTVDDIKNQIQFEATKLAQNAISSCNETVNRMKADLENHLPRYDQEVEKVISEIVEIASSAAGEGIDISTVVKEAVLKAIASLRQSLDAATKTIEDFISEASKKLINLLESLLPEWFKPLIQGLQAVSGAVQSFLEMGRGLLKNATETIFNKISSIVQKIVKNVDEVLGPIWKFVKRIWKALFGEEPEHCEIALRWFETRMKRIEMEMLYHPSATPVRAVIRKRKFFELLAPDQNAWKSQISEFLNRNGSASGWRRSHSHLRSALVDKEPEPGKMAQLTWDEPFVDELGGYQRVQICILYYRWRTEEFRKVSAGFLGILAMISIE